MILPNAIEEIPNEQEQQVLKEENTNSTTSVTSEVFTMSKNSLELSASSSSLPHSSASKDEKLDITDKFTVFNHDDDVNEGHEVTLKFASDLNFDELPSEETLENLLLDSASPYLSDSTGNYKTNSLDDDDDEINAELSRLAAAEEDVRTELEMLMNTGFHQNVDDVQSIDDDASSIYSNLTNLTNDNDDTQSLHSLSHYDQISSPTTNYNNYDEKTMSSPTPSKSLDQKQIPMTNEQYFNLMKSRWQEQANEVGIKKIFVKNNENSLRACYTCPLLAYDSIQKLSFSSENHSKPEISPQHEEVYSQSNFEYMQPMPSYFLRQIYTGLVLPQSQSNSENKYKNVNTINEHSTQKQSQSNIKSDPNIYEIDPTEPVPIRTCSLRIRPDVLCGSVMDALSNTVNERSGEIVKRQGGHMMAKIPGYWLQRKDRSYNYSNKDQNMNSAQSKRKKRKVWLPPFCFDAQLCAKKSTPHQKDFNNHERILLIRIYAMNLDSRVLRNMKRNKYREDRSFVSISSMLDPKDDEDLEFGKKKNEKVKERSSDQKDILKQAAYIVYQMERVNEQERQARMHDFATSPISGPNSSSPFLPGITSSVSRNSNQDMNIVSRIGNMLVSPIRILADTNSATPFHNKKDYPSLASTNSHLLESSFRFFVSCVTELETRELAYTSLAISSFGKFPALPSLDIHYCSQLRQICRETMVINLLETASGMEQYTRDMEISCAEFVNFLSDGSIKDYRMEKPSFPQMIPLNSYPLDFRQPEIVCPPWGEKVKHALENISNEGIEVNFQSILDFKNNDSETLQIKVDETGNLNMTDNSKYDGTQIAEDAVKNVVQAFSDQFDEEQCARLGRKNMQVMDRMAKIQALKRDTVIKIRDSYGQNRESTKTADRFHSMASQVKGYISVNSANSYKHRSLPYMDFRPSDQIPIFKCGILVGNSTGLCYVTSYQLLFVTQAIPILGGSKYTLLNIADVEFVLTEQSKTSLLFKSSHSGLSARLYKASIPEKQNHSMAWIIENTEEVFSFVPSIGSGRFKRFINMIKSVTLEDPETLKFTPKGGFIYVESG